MFVRTAVEIRPGNRNPFVGLDLGGQAFGERGSQVTDLFTPLSGSLVGPAQRAT